MNKTTQPLLLSLKPRYADLIFAGRKKAELRRRIASGIEGRDVFIYVSSPVKQLRGGFRVGHVWQGSPRKFGTRYLKLLASIGKVLIPIMKGVKLLMLYKSRTFGNMKTRLI